MVSQQRPAGDVNRLTPKSKGARRRLDNADTDSLAVRRALVAFVAFVVPLALAFNGGAYDLVIRQQMALPWLWAMAIAAAFGFLPLARRNPAVARVLTALAVFGLWTALSVLWSDSVERTSIEIARTLAYAGVLAAILLALNASTWRSAAFGLCAALLVLPVFALVSRLDPAAFPTAGDPSSPGGDRLLYPLEYWNAVACWSAMAIVAGVSLSAHCRNWVRRASLALAPVAFVTLYLTYSRGGIAAALVGCLTLLVLSRNRVTAAVHLAAVVGAGFLAIAVIQSQAGIAEGTSGAGGALVALAVLAGSLGCGAIAHQTGLRGLDRYHVSLPSGKRVAAATLVVAAVAIAVAGPSLAARESLQFTDRSYVSNQPTAARLASLDGPRAEIWSSAVRAFESAPVTGIGPGTFVYWWTGDVKNGARLQDAHTLYIETLAELGLPGLLGLLAVLGLLLATAMKARRGVRRARDAGAATAMISIGAVFLTQAGVDWMWEIPAITVPGLAALAIAGAAASHPARRSRKVTGGALGLAMLCVIAGAAQIPGLVTTQSLRTSSALLPGGFDDRARKLAEDAQAASPWAASPHTQLALIDLAQGDAAGAGPEIDEAIDLEPTNWALPFLEVRVRLAQGDAKGALSALARAVDLNPSIADDAARIRARVEAGDVGEPRLTGGG